jgi:hypothetical protein
MLEWSNGADLLIGETYFRFWSISDVIGTNASAGVQFYLPHTIAIGCDASDTWYLLDYRVNAQQPALIEIEAGSLCANNFTVCGTSLEAAFRTWSGIDDARARLLGCIAARAWQQ